MNTAVKVASIAGPPAMKELPVIYTMVEQRPRAVEMFETAEVLQAAAITINPIVDDLQAARAAEMRAQAQQLDKEMDEQRLDTTKGLRGLVDWWNATFNARQTVVKGLVKSLDKALKAYMDEKARKQREEQARLEEARRAENAKRAAEAEQLGTEPPAPLPPAVTPPAANPFKITGSHGASLGQRSNWKWRVKDISKVPEDLLVPPEERIIKTAMNSLAKTKAKAYIAALHLPDGAEEPKVIADAIPGIELYNDPNLASSTL